MNSYENSISPSVSDSADSPSFQSYKNCLKELNENPAVQDNLIEIARLSALASPETSADPENQPASWKLELTLCQKYIKHIIIYYRELIEDELNKSLTIIAGLKVIVQMFTFPIIGRADEV